MHVPIMFKEDASDNPNKNLGILAGCAGGKLFTEGTWNSEICKEMTPKEGDVLIKGKKGLDAFPNTTLEAELKKAGIETVVLCGLLTTAASSRRCVPRARRASTSSPSPTAALPPRRRATPPPPPAPSASFPRR